MANRTENSAKNVSTGVILRLLIMALRFATRTLFVRYLGSEYLGINGLISSILSFLNITDLGIGLAIVYAMYKPIAQNDQEKIRQYVAYYKKIYHLLGIAILAIGLAVMPFLKYMVDMDSITVDVNIYVVYGLYLLSSVSSFYIYAYRGGFLSACQQEYKLAPSNYITNIATTLLQVVSLVFFKSFYLYLALPILATIMQRIINGLFIAKWHPYIKQPPVGKLSKEEKVGLFKNTYGLAISKISGIINNSIDNVIISSLIGITAVGLYSNYYTLFTMVTGFVDVIFVSLKPSVGNLNVEVDIKQKKKIFNTIYFTSFWIYGFCAICFFVLAQPFIKIWIGEQYLMSTALVFAVCLNLLTTGMTMATNVYREACGLYYQGRYRPIFTALFNIGFSVLFGKFFGAAGIVFATILSRMITIWWFDAYIVFKHVFDEKPWKYLINYLIKIVYVVVLGGAVYYVCTLIKGNVFVVLVLRAIVCVVLVNAAYALCFHRTEEFKEVQAKVNALTQKIFKKFKRA